jgi:hypothetical protein
MPRLLTRILALLLIPSFLVNPALAAVFNEMPARAPHADPPFFALQAIPAPVPTGRVILHGHQALIGALVLSLVSVSCGRSAEMESPKKQPSHKQTTDAIPQTEALPERPKNVRFNGPGHAHIFHSDAMGGTGPSHQGFDPDKDFFNVEIPLKNIKDLDSFMGIQIYLKPRTPDSGSLAIFFEKSTPDFSTMFITEDYEADLHPYSSIIVIPFYPTPPKFEPFHDTDKLSDWPRVAQRDIVLRFQSDSGDHLKIDHVELVPIGGQLSNLSTSEPQLKPRPSDVDHRKTPRWVGEQPMRNPLDFHGDRVRSRRSHDEMSRRGWVGSLEGVPGNFGSSAKKIAERPIFLLAHILEVPALMNRWHRASSDPSTADESGHFYHIVSDHFDMAASALGPHARRLHLSAHDFQRINTALADFLLLVQRDAEFFPILGDSFFLNQLRNILNASFVWGEVLNTNKPDAEARRAKIANITWHKILALIEGLWRIAHRLPIHENSMFTPRWPLHGRRALHSAA